MYGQETAETGDAVRCVRGIPREASGNTITISTDVQALIVVQVRIIMHRFRCQSRDHDLGSLKKVLFAVPFPDFPYPRPHDHD